MKINTDSKKIEELLNRGVENIYPTREFLEKELKSGRQLTLYTGYDPTAPTLHVGHGITMMKLRQFQDLGHKIIMLIGDFTGMIGDPTDKTAARKKLTREEVLENCKNYKKQASSILNFEGENSVEVKYNSDWLGKLNLYDILDLTSHFTVQRMMERDMFEKRLKNGWIVVCPNSKCNQKYHYKNEKVFKAYDGLSSDTIKSIFNKKCEKCDKLLSAGDMGPIIIREKEDPIYLHEFLYPLMQAYDSVAMNVDGEVGGNDQTFNMLAGRDLMKDLKNKEKFVLTMKLLTDNSGKKMGKSEGNMVALSDTPEDMFGKVMSWDDNMIMGGFELCTKVSTEEAKKIDKDFSNPRDKKLRLAEEIVKNFLGEAEAKKAQDYFVSTFSKKEIPDEIPEISPTTYDIITVLVESKICKSKSEARQNIDQGGVKINEQKVEAKNYTALVKAMDVVQKGSRFFVRVK